MDNLLETIMPWGQYKGMPLRQIIQTKYGREFICLAYERMREMESYDPLLPAFAVAVKAAKATEEEIRVTESHRCPECGAVQKYDSRGPAIWRKPRKT